MVPADTAVAASAVPVGTAADIAVYFVVDLGIAVEEPDCKAADIEAVQEHTLTYIQPIAFTVPSFSMVYLFLCSSLK